MAKVPARWFRYDIVLHQGMDEYYPMRLAEPDGTTPDLTEWSATLNLYRSAVAVESIHDEPPILAGGTNDGLVSLGLFDGGEFGPYNAYMALVSSLTSSLIPWGIGSYNLDIIDPFGHVQYRVAGIIKLEEGTRHG